MTHDGVIAAAPRRRPLVTHSWLGRVFNVGAVLATIVVLFWCGLRLADPYEFVPALRFVALLSLLVVVHEALHVVALRVCGLSLAPYRFKRLGLRIGLLGPTPQPSLPSS